MKYFINIITAMVIMAVCCSCEHSRTPPYEIKPVGQRTIIAIDNNGIIYDVAGMPVKQLTNCEVVTQMIAVEGDYFVAGVNSKGLIGYWKNDKWNTLHIDFIDDVNHWTFGIAKWDYNIYLIDPPNVLHNSGIFPLRDSELFVPAPGGISVSEGTCRVVGYELDTMASQQKVLPVIYSERKGAYEKQYLPLPDGATFGKCMAVFAYDTRHYLIGGCCENEPVLWIDGEVSVLPRLNTEFDAGNFSGELGAVNSVVRTGGHIYAGGCELRSLDGRTVATLWVDGVPQHLELASDGNNIMSSVRQMQAYGDDVYVLTWETRESMVGDWQQIHNVLWLNGEPVAHYTQMLVSFAVY